MNPWSLTSFSLVLALIPCGVVCLFFKNPIDRVIGASLSSTLGAFVFISEAMATQLSSLIDLALVAAFLSFGGSLVFVRFLERWE